MRLATRSLTLAAALSLFAPAGCALDQGGTGEPAGDLGEGGKADSSEEASPMGPAADAAWRAYVGSLDLPAIQDGCRPFRSRLPESVAYRGVAVLFHGFTACPQQFEETAERLGEQGFVVLAPLLPGHGRRPTLDPSGAARDDVRFLPEEGAYLAYAQLAKRMDEVVATAPGTRMVAGISVGGAIAARAAEDGVAFDRAALLNSFFDAAGFSALLLSPTSALAPHSRQGWGAGCEQERARGRAGYCQFEITHLRAVQRFGRETASRAASIDITIQNVGLENDQAASPKAIADVGWLLPAGTTCFFERGVNHSLLSRYDSPDEDKYWIPATLDQLVRFGSDGTPFDQTWDGIVEGYPHCRSR